MIKKINLVFLFAILFTSVQGQKVIINSKGFPIKSIERYQRKCKFDYNPPENFVEKPVTPLANLKYDVNLVNDSTDFCLRYSFFTGKDGSSFWLYQQFNTINFANLTQEDSTAVVYADQPYDSTIISKVNCDVAGFVDFDIKSSYGKGYKYCTMIAIHKKRVTNLYLTLLYNEKDSVIYEKMFDSAINSIYFRQDSKYNSK
jgi:hypothetical protein